MALIAVAESAQDMAAAFHKFLDPVPESAAEINGLLSELYAISSALRDLNTAIAVSLHNPRYSLISDHVRDSIKSLRYTIDDVRRLIAGLRRPIYLSDSAAYRGVWREISLYFQNESSTSLCLRLEFYRRFFHSLLRILEGLPVDRREFNSLQDRIDGLLSVQNTSTRLEDELAGMHLGNPEPPRRSFERPRPLNDPPSPESPIFQHRGGGGRRPDPRSPLSPGFDQNPFGAPFAPEVPLSPTTASTFSTQSSSNNSVLTHWVPRVFDQSRSTTPFRTIGQTSACFGTDMPNVSTKLAEEYDKLQELPFENSELIIRLYFRPSDSRARIHCRTSRPNRPRMQCCLPLTSLEVFRVDSCLQLCRPSHSRRTFQLWTALRFISYERMILFFCTFIALKAQDAGDPVQITDHELRGEDLQWSGIILDDHYEHALRLFKDRDSGGLRLQASIESGELNKTPVWTAFITHNVSSPSWMWQAARKIVHLADLQRYIFTTEYTPRLGPGGEHELRFLHSNDAITFMERIDILAAEQV